MHITIKNCEFNSNGTTSGPAVINIIQTYDNNSDLYSILLQGNIFKHNTSHADHPVIHVFNKIDITPAHLDGEQKRSIIMLNNTFEENGSHGNGVVHIDKMPNVEIEDNNVFLSNTDAVDLNTKVLAEFIDKRYYLKEYLPQDTF